MKRDITSQAHSLAFDVLGRTEEKAKQFTTSFPTEAEAHVIAKSLLKELLRLLDLVDAQPHTTIRQSDGLVRLKPTSRLTVQDWRRLSRHNRSESRAPQFLQRNESTLQTSENAFVKWTLLTTTRRLAILLNQVTASAAHDPRQASDPFSRQVREVYQAIRNRARRGFLADVEARPPATQHLSLVFQLHPIYRLIYHVCLLLLSGLELEGYAFQMGMKDVATIYEYWSFLAIISILRRHATLESSDVVKVEKRRASLVLLKGHRSTVVLRKATGSSIAVSYNPVMSPIWTTPQQPDAVIEIATEDTRLILDAKYRLQFDEKYVRMYGGPGPMEDDINKMHRYRDSVLFVRSGKDLKAQEAVALFPLPNSVQYGSNHRLYRSVDIVGVGGMPAYPDNLGALEAYLIKRLSLTG
jgi:predicted component of viral defense system (DUF524 family)